MHQLKKIRSGATTVVFPNTLKVRRNTKEDRAFQNQALIVYFLQQPPSSCPTAHAHMSQRVYAEHVISEALLSTGWRDRGQDLVIFQSMHPIQYSAFWIQRDGQSILVLEYQLLVTHVQVTGAQELTVRRVEELMTFQCPFGFEFLATHVTEVGLLGAVAVHMSLEVALAASCIFTKRTFEGLHTYQGEMHTCIFTGVCAAICGDPEE